MKKSVIVFTTYSGYFLIGVVAIIFAPTLPAIIAEFNISVGSAGVIFPAYAAGILAGVFFGGFLSDILGRKLLVIIGCILQFFGLVLTAIMPIWVFIPVLFILTGLGRGFLSTTLNALVSDINPDRRGAALNILHGIYGLGCLIGPFITGLLLSFDYSWRMVYFGAAGLWLVFMLVNMTVSYPVFTRLKKSYSKRTSIKHIFLNPVFMLLFLVSFIYNGAATGLVGWINTYMDTMKFPVLLGAGMISVFYLGLTLGRFICSYFSDKAGYSKTILTCAIGSFLFYPLTIFTSHAVTIAAGVFLSGLFLSGLHPTGLAYANTIYSSISGTITGLLSTSMSLGAMSVPWLIGIVAEQSGFKSGLSIGYVLIVILVFVSVLLLFWQKKHEK